MRQAPSLNIWHWTDLIIGALLLRLLLVLGLAGLGGGGTRTITALCRHALKGMRCNPMQDSAVRAPLPRNTKWGFHHIMLLCLQRHDSIPVNLKTGTIYQTQFCHTC